MWLAVLIAAPSFLGIWAIAPLAAASNLPLIPSSIVDRGVPAITTTWAGGERRLPLTMPGGRIEHDFPDGVPLTMEGGAYLAEESTEAVTLVRDVGRDTGMPVLANRLLGAYNYNLPYTVSYALPESDPRYPYDYRYPYSYAEIDPIVETELNAEVVADKRAQLVELSTALLYADRAPAAYSLLRRIQSFGPDCDAQLNLAMTVAIGYRPPVDAVDTEFTKAIELCSSDPLAFVAYSRVVLARTRGPIGPFLTYSLGELGQEQPAVAIARQAQQKFPSHAGGYLAEATILLEIADRYARAGVHPFTTRAMYRQASDLLTAVQRVMPDDVTVIYGKARANAGQGHVAEAIGDATRVVETFSSQRVAAGLQLHQWLLDQGDLAVALSRVPDLENSIKQADGSLRKCRSLFPVGFLQDRRPPDAPEPGWRDSCFQHVVDATGGEFPGGADSLEFYDYIPKYRPQQFGGDPYEFGFVAVAAGQAGSLSDIKSGDNERWAMLAKVLDGDWNVLTGRSDFSLSFLRIEMLDTFQNKFRRVGRLEDAAKLLRAAISHPELASPVAYDRLGEVQFLLEDYANAAASFESAARLINETDPALYGLDGWEVTSAADFGTDWEAIKTGAALVKAHRFDEALKVVPRPEPEAEGDTPYPDYTLNRTEIARTSLVGQVGLLSGDYSASIAAYQEALELCAAWANSDIHPCGSGVQDNNLAVAYLKSGDDAKAAEHARSAIAADPANPMYVEALANAEEQAGHAGAAIEAYKATLTQDATQFTAQNNVGVLLAQAGDLAGATEHFRLAVGAKSDYAVGWFNLGHALESRSDLRGVLASQGAFGRAAVLSPRFRGADPQWVSDLTVYSPGLDLSKPLPENWSAGTSRQSLPAGFSWVVIGGAVLMVVRALVGDDFFSRVTEKALSVLHRITPARTAGRYAGEPFALVACAAVLWVGLAVAFGWSPWLTANAGVLALLLPIGFVAVRKVIGSPQLHTLNLGGLVTAAVLAPFGSIFVPVPVARDPALRPFERWAPIIAMATISGICLGLTTLTGVPFLRQSAQAAALIVGSALIPVLPLDGARLPRSLGLIAAVLLMIPSAFFAAGLV